MKSCSNKNCKQVNPQPLDNFTKHSHTKDGLQVHCKHCRNSINKALRKENKDKYREVQIQWNMDNKDKIQTIEKKWQKANPEKLRAKSMRKKYGISIAEYDFLLLKQEDQCGICKRHKSSFTIRLCIDHNHSTGKIRGLLCSNCNRGLGLFQDRADWLRNAANYLDISDGKMSETSTISWEEKTKE
jgi:copper chaperone CopZ